MRRALPSLIIVSPLVEPQWDDSGTSGTGSALATASALPAGWVRSCEGISPSRLARPPETKESTVIRLLEGLPENVVGVEASGKVTDEDYERVLIPAVRERIGATGKVRFLYVLGEDFDGWTLGGMWEDAKLGGSEVKSWEKVAIVTDKDWLRHMVKAFAWMLPGEVRVFELSARDDATAWAAS